MKYQDMISTNTADKQHTQVRFGYVVSDKMSKTITVEIKRRFLHPQFGKVISVSKKFYAHDEAETATVGDLVRIQETRPLSKLKRWRLVEVITPGAEARAPGGL